MFDAKTVSISVPVRLLVTDPAYPSLLRAVSGPPKHLYAMGNLKLLEKEKVAIVGTRKASQKAFEFARSLSSEISSSGLVVVSGGALGIDSAANEGALEANGDTIAVLPSGFDNPYPAENAGLFRKIAEKGLLLSEYAPNEKPQRFTFLQRNRITSGISKAVIIIATGIDGGSMQQAKVALEQKKPLFCPSPELGLEPTEGVSSLIQTGKAKAFDNSVELLDALKGMRR